MVSWGILIFYPGRKGKKQDSLLEAVLKFLEKIKTTSTFILFLEITGQWTILQYMNIRF